MKHDCRRFNELGLQAAADVLDEMRQGGPRDLPDSLVTDEQVSEVIGGSLQIPKNGFPTRWQLGAWLYRELERAVQDTKHLRDPGLWTWLAFMLFPLICPPNTRIRENARYILNRDDYRKRYRHLVAGPYFVFAAHESQPQIIRGLLASPPHAPGDLYEQFASRQELVTSGAVLRVITSMYIDESTGKLKRGAATNARRLADVLMQYDVTYDFVSLPAEHLINMLPAEFRRFTNSLEA